MENFNECQTIDQPRDPHAWLACKGLVAWISCRPTCVSPIRSGCLLHHSITDWVWLVASPVSWWRVCITSPVNIDVSNTRNNSDILCPIPEIWTIYCISKDLKSIRLVLLGTIVRKYFGLKNSLDSCEISPVLSVRSFGPRAVFQYLVYRLVVMWSDSRSNCTLYRRERDCTMYTVQVDWRHLNTLSSVASVLPVWSTS